MSFYVQGFHVNRFLRSGVLTSVQGFVRSGVPRYRFSRSWVLTFRGSYVQGLYIHTFLRSWVLRS